MVSRFAKDFVICCHYSVCSYDNTEIVSFLLSACQDPVCNFLRFLQRQFFHNFRGMRARYDLLPS